MSHTSMRGRWRGPIALVADQLLCLCVAARSDGLDFPAVWTTILKPSRLVVGRPIQTFVEGKAALKVRLTTNDYIVCGPDGYSVG
jgi:hypothetical protein